MEYAHKFLYIHTHQSYKNEVFPLEYGNGKVGTKKNNVP